MKRMMCLVALCLVATVQAVEPEAPQAEVAESASATDSTRMVDLDFWMMPRDAGSVLRQAAIAQSVRELLSDPDAYLEIAYPAGEMGELWGQELQAWLVALGVVSDRIELKASSGPVEGIGLHVVHPTAAQEVLINIDQAPATMPAPATDQSREAAVAEPPASTVE